MSICTHGSVMSYCPLCSDWISFNGPWSRYDWDLEPGQALGFKNQDLAQPGTLVEFEGGKVVLIGHMNANGGLCDCCSDVEGSDVVVRYKRIWQPPPGA